MQILGDAVAEDTEEFSVGLTNASGATIVADTARAAILDDDGNAPDFNYGEALQKALPQTEVEISSGQSSTSVITLSGTLYKAEDVRRRGRVRAHEALPSALP